MNLRDMTMAELCDRLKSDLDAYPHSWGTNYPKRLLAELKRKCEAQLGMPPNHWWDVIEAKAKSVGWGHKVVQRLRRELKKRCKGVVVLVPPPPIPARGFTCPCTVMGERVSAVIMDENAFAICPKCGKRAEYAHLPCFKCRDARGPAPTGYEHVGEWRLAKADEYYLSASGDEALLAKAGELRPHPEIDGGKRWILRKLPDVLCPKCGRNLAGDDQLGYLIDGKPCHECCIARPLAPAGHEFTGEWGKPNGRIYLAFVGGEPVPCVLPTSEPQWILKKVEAKPSECCGTCHVWDSIDGLNGLCESTMALPGQHKKRAHEGPCWVYKRKVEAEGESWAKATVTSLEDLTRRIEKLEKQQ